MRGHVINTYKFLKGECEEVGAKFFSVVPSDKMRRDAHKLKYRKFHLNVRKNFLTPKVADHWDRQALRFPSLRTFKIYSHVPVRSGLDDAALARGLDEMIFRGPLQP